MANVSYPRVPEGLDWLSLDYYPSEGTVAGVVRLFREQLQASLTVSRKVGSSANVHSQEVDTAASFGQLLLTFDARATAGATEKTLIDSLRARLEELRNVNRNCTVLSA